jgi:hypothetical protein
MLKSSTSAVDAVSGTADPADRRGDTGCSPELRENRPSSTSTLLLWNATSHADPHSHDCPSAAGMQHLGGADVTVALHR